MYIHGEGRVTNSNYSLEEGIPHYLLSRDSSGQYFSNNVVARLFDELKEESYVFNREIIHIDKTKKTSSILGRFSSHYRRKV